MITKCSICGAKLDALFPLLAEHPNNKICSACSIQKSYIVDAANRNDAPALQEAADAFMARTCVDTTDEVKSDMHVIIQRFQGMLLNNPQSAVETLHIFPSTASDHLDGKKIVKYCAIVGANAVVLIDALKPGHESSVHIAKLNNHQQMINQAKALDANALINFKNDFVVLNNSYILISSYADAVKVE